jgi:hypothetical protein
MTTRQRLISLGLIKPYTADNRAASILASIRRDAQSMAKAIASRRRETGNVISITTKRSINISHGRTSA